MLRAKAFQRKFTVVRNARLVVGFQNALSADDPHLVTIGKLFKYAGALSVAEIAVALGEVQIVLPDQVIDPCLDGLS